MKRFVHKKIKSMLRNLTPLLFAGLGVAVSGCAWLGDDRGLIVDRSDDYLDAQSHEPLAVPPDLGLASLEGGVVLPDAISEDDPRYFPENPPRPEVLYGLREGESIRLQRLGERRWLLVPEPVSEVWPKFMRFMSDFGISVQDEARVYGQVATQWIEVSTEGGSPIQGLIRDSRGDAQAGESDRFVFRLESSLREATTEIHARHQSDALEAEGREWPDASVDAELENAILLEAGRFLGSNLGTSSVSLLGADVRTKPKARIEDDDSNRPILIFELDFERTWATIRLSLEAAGAEIKDLDREERVIYVTFSKQALLEGDEPGFFGRMLNFGRRDEVDLKIRVAELGSDWSVHVSLSDDRPADRDTSEGVLGLIRENAS